jgi:hypothetical protein
MSCDYCSHAFFASPNIPTSNKHVQTHVFNANEHGLLLIYERKPSDTDSYFCEIEDLEINFCPMCGRALNRKPKWLHRLEATDPEHGLWYDGSGNWVFDVGAIGCSTKDLPMDYDWRYKRDGRDWFSSCSSKEDLLHWYSEEDAKRLREIGFVMAKYLATEYVEYEVETTFIKETSLERVEVPLEGLWQ